MRRRYPKRPDVETMPSVNPHAAGLDIGSEEIWACVPEDRDAQPVRPFGTFTPDLHALAGWLTACRIETVAMASTGMNGIPIDELLEVRGFKVYLVNARHLKHVPGRQRDGQDGQWIQHLHTCGLLSGSCRPEAERCALRAYWRHRATRLEHRAAPLQPRPKALQQMNVQLTQMLTDSSGVTRLAMIRAIVAGERDPVQLARFRDRRCASSTGVELVAIPGLNTSTVPTMLSATGLALRQWPHAKAFCACLGLAPHHAISGRKIVRRSMFKTRNRAGQAFRLAAHAVSRSRTSVGLYDRRMRARLGPQSAIVATAHKIARIVYHLLIHRTPVQELSATAYERRTRDRDIAALRKRATKLGFTWVESCT